MHNYQFLEDQHQKPLLINYGELGRCQLLSHRITKNLYVLKMAKNEIQVQKDIQYLTSISHPNIISLCDHFVFDNNIVMIFEFLANGDLFTKIRCNQIKRKDISRIFRQICEAIQYIHEQKVIHRNLKSENILFDDEMVPKVVDFCYAARLTTRKTFCGCTYYMAPEILNQQPYSQKVDVWALGVILYEMVYGKMPFEEEAPSQILSKIHKSKPLSNIYPRNSVQDLISKMMRVQTQYRITLKQALNHPYLYYQLQQNHKFMMPLRKVQILHQKPNPPEKDTMMEFREYMNNKLTAIFKSDLGEKKKRKWREHDKKKE